MSSPALKTSNALPVSWWRDRLVPYLLLGPFLVLGAAGALLLWAFVTARRAARTLVGNGASQA